MRIARWFAELRRRNVLRAGLLYVGAVWALAQGLAQLAPVFGASESLVRWFLVAAAIGFPFWLALAWVYELTPAGLKRESELARDASLRRGNMRRFDLAIILVLVIAVVLLATHQLMRDDAPSGTDPVATATAARSVAVLPFENLSGHADNGYFVAGMQDLIATKLAGVRELKVVPRTSTDAYQGRAARVRDIGAELGVATVLEGSVQRSGDRVLVNVKLLSASDERQLWAESYQRTLDDVFGVEGEIAAKVAAALRAQLSPDESAFLAQAPTHSKPALDLYLRAEYLAARGHRDYDTGNLAAAVQLYRQAIAQDPSFAQAIARLSYVEGELAWFGGGGEDTASLVERARLDAERAIALAPDLAAAYLARGYSAYWGRADYKAALQAFRHAQDLQPGDPAALVAQAFVLRRGGSTEQAIGLLERARTLDPRNSSLLFETGVVYMMAGRFEPAVERLQQALRLDPDNLNARYFLSNALLFSTGDVEKAIAPLRGDNAYMQLQRGTLRIYQRRYREALAEVVGVPDAPENFQPGLNPPKSLQLADLHRMLGEPAAAAPLYRKALEQLEAQRKGQSGLNLAFVWANIAGANIGLGRVDAALAALATSRSTAEASEDHAAALISLLLVAQGYAQLERADLAVPLLESMLGRPELALNYAPVMLWVDSAWDPIRADPRFRQLQSRFAGSVPASVGGRRAAAG